MASKLRVDIPPEVHARLRQVARERDCSVLDVVSRALALYECLHMEQQHGRSVYTGAPDRVEDEVTVAAPGEEKKRAVLRRIDFR